MGERISRVGSQAQNWLGPNGDAGSDIGGDDRDRTDDLVIANDALSQLSYVPTKNLSYLHVLRAMQPRSRTSL